MRMIPGVLVWSVTASLLAQAPPKLILEPLAITVSKLKRDSFGNGVNPFGSKFNSGGTYAAGTALLIKVTPESTFEGVIVGEVSKLDQFADDKGSDLLAGGESLNQFWNPNKPFSIAEQVNSKEFALELRSARSPSDEATKVIGSGVLVFALPGTGAESQQENLEIVPKTPIRVGPILLNFTNRASMESSSPRPSASTAATEPKNTPKTRDRDKEEWFVQILPDADVVNVTLLLFGEDPDVPLLNTGLKNELFVFRSSGSKDAAKDPFNGAPMIRFSVSGNRLSRVKLRYFVKDNLVEVPFKIECGLGLGPAH